MNRVTTTATAPSAKSSSTPSNGGVQVPTAHIAEQSITAFTHVETLNDPDSGKRTLCVAADQTLSDFREASSSDVVHALTNTERARLNRIDRLAAQFFQDQADVKEPRTWTVADYDSGMPLNVTCMSGCHTLHAERSIGMSRAVDVKCAQYDTANTVELQIGCSGEDFGGYATLSVEIKSDPVHPDPAKRVPVAAIEVTEDHYIEDLDPDALAVVIDKLDQRVAAMRVRHADLVRIRAEHFGRQA